MLEAGSQRHLALQFPARFRNPLVLALLAASAISASAGDAANFFIIIAPVLLSVALDFLRNTDLPRAGQVGPDHIEFAKYGTTRTTALVESNPRTPPCPRAGIYRGCRHNSKALSG